MRHEGFRFVFPGQIVEHTIDARCGHLPDPWHQQFATVDTIFERSTVIVDLYVYALPSLCEQRSDWPLDPTRRDFSGVFGNPNIAERCNVKLASARTQTGQTSEGIQYQPKPT